MIYFILYPLKKDENKAHKVQELACLAMHVTHNFGCGNMKHPYSISSEFSSNRNI